MKSQRPWMRLVSMPKNVARCFVACHYDLANGHIVKARENGPSLDKLTPQTKILRAAKCLQVGRRGAPTPAQEEQGSIVMLGRAVQILPPRRNRGHTGLLGALPEGQAFPESLHRIVLARLVPAFGDSIGNEQPGFAGF